MDLCLVIRYSEQKFYFMHNITLNSSLVFVLICCVSFNVLSGGFLLFFKEQPIRIIHREIAWAKGMPPARGFLLEQPSLLEAPEQ